MQLHWFCPVCGVTAGTDSRRSLFPVCIGGRTHGAHSASPLIYCGVGEQGLRRMHRLRDDVLQGAIPLLLADEIRANVRVTYPRILQWPRPGQPGFESIQDNPYIILQGIKERRSR